MDKRPHYLIDSLFGWRYGNLAYYVTVALLLFIALSGVLIRHDLFRARWGFVAVALALVPVMAEWATGIRFPWPMKFLLTLGLAMHMAGGIFEFYFTYYPLYDKFCHLVSTMGIVLLLFVFILVLGGLTGKNFHRKTVIISIFLTTMVFALVWEYAELWLDLSTGTSYFVDPFDSVFDMIFNLIATTYIVANLNEYLKRETLLDLYRRWINWRGELR